MEKYLSENKRLKREKVHAEQRFSTNSWTRSGNQESCRLQDASAKMIKEDDRFADLYKATRTHLVSTRGVTQATSKRAIVALCRGRLQG